jgi:hypothetical protein
VSRTEPCTSLCHNERFHWAFQFVLDRFGSVMLPSARPHPTLELIRMGPTTFRLGQEDVSPKSED